MNAGAELLTGTRYALQTDTSGGGERNDMAFADKFKDLTKQAKEAVAESKDKIHEAVDAVSAVADEKTHGKYTAKIAKFGQKATDAVDKLSADPEQPAAEQPETEQAESRT